MSEIQEFMQEHLPQSFLDEVVWDLIEKFDVALDEHEDDWRENILSHFPPEYEDDEEALIQVLREVYKMAFENYGFFSN